MTHTTLAFFMAALISTGAIASESEQDWPGFRGSTVGRIDERPGSFARLDRIGMRVAWRVTLGSGYSSVSIADGRAVTMFSDDTWDYIISLDAESGEEQWRYRIGETHRGHDGSHDGPISTPLIAEGHVFGLSPQGKLFAVDVGTGAEAWAVQMVEEQKAAKPYYGYATSPLLVDGVLVVAVNAGEGRTVLGLDPASGRVEWAAGDDMVSYQSPSSMEIGGKMQLLVVGDKKLEGIEASTGKLLWAYEHGGDTTAMGAQSMNLVPAGDGRVLVARKVDEAEMLRLTSSPEGMEVESLWTSKTLRGSYATSVYHEGYLYGFRGRILTCVDAETGEMRWRSRPPGDGFLTLVDGHLFIITKTGSLHVARATPDGYKEVDQMDLFDGYTWTPLAVANGHIYARGFEEVASIALSEATAGGDMSGKLEISFPESDFGRFVASLGAAADKQARLDEYFENVASFPILEGDRLIHFVYRGPADDVAMVGDVIGDRREQPMQRVPGTDLFFFSAELEPDSRVAYRFIKDLEEDVLDPRNPRKDYYQQDEMSWASMPKWRIPTHIGEPKSEGRVDSIEIESAAFEGKRTLDVYLPVGYDSEPDRRYPVAYVHLGKAAMEWGGLRRTLDNLIDNELEPLIAVFVDTPGNPGREHFGPPKRDGKYTKFFLDEVVPYIDANYRSIAEPASRGNIGMGMGALTALATTGLSPGTFGRVSLQSIVMLTFHEDVVWPMLEKLEGSKPTVFMEWGRYDARADHEGWNMIYLSRRLADYLEELGYELKGDGEVPEGTGWGAWKSRADRIFVELFPLE